MANNDVTCWIQDLEKYLYETYRINLPVANEDDFDAYLREFAFETAAGRDHLSKNHLLFME